MTARVNVYFYLLRQANGYKLIFFFLPLSLSVCFWHFPLDQWCIYLWIRESAGDSFNTLSNFGLPRRPAFKTHVPKWVSFFSLSLSLPRQPAEAASSQLTRLVKVGEKLIRCSLFFEGLKCYKWSASIWFNLIQRLQKQFTEEQKRCQWCWL